jgi:HPt (histidine-containing phosphotransfer) domain-containing protein
MTQPTIDRATFDDLKETAGAEFAVELVDTFLAEAPVMLEELHGALLAGDADRFRRTAHSLKSNCNTFGALPLAVMARQLELEGLKPVHDGGGKQLDALAQEYARVAHSLTELKRA